MATLRKWFEELNVDLSKLVLVAHAVGGSQYPGWRSATAAVKFDFRTPGALDVHPHPLLDTEFDDSYGGPQAPRFVAQDEDWIYFVGTYDGSTWLQPVNKNLDFYMNHENEVPYVGG